MIRRSFKFRLYPTAKQVEALNLTLSECCRLYNASIQERRDAWTLNRVSVNFYTQSEQLPSIRAEGFIESINAQVLQNVLRRSDRTFQAFYRRCKSGEKPGYPKFKSWKRYDSFTFPQSSRGVKIINSKLRMHGIGLVKVKFHRELEGKIKTVTIKREGAKWFAIFSNECEAKILESSTEAIGIDVGISAFVSLSNGTQIENRREYESEQKRLRIAQRRVARRKKGSNRRRKAVAMLRAIHTKIRNRRHDFQHKLSRTLVNQYGLIAVEDLNVKGLSKGILSKQVLDAGWSAFIGKLAYKAEEAGRYLVKVPAAYTSQDCSNCGYREKKTLAQRVHNCDYSPRINAGASQDKR